MGTWPASGKKGLAASLVKGLQAMAAKSPEALADEWDSVEERFELNPHEHQNSLIKSHHVPSVEDLPDHILYASTSADSTKCLGCYALKSVSPKKAFVSAAVIGGSQNAQLGYTSVDAFKRLRRVNESLTFTVGSSPLLFETRVPGGEHLTMLVCGMSPSQYLQHWRWKKRHLTFVFGDDFLQRGGLAKPGVIPILLLSGVLWADAVVRGRAGVQPPVRVSVGEHLTLKLLEAEPQIFADAAQARATYSRIDGWLFARGFEIKFAGVGELLFRPNWHHSFVTNAGIKIGPETVSHLKHGFLKWFSEQYMDDEQGHKVPRLVQAQPCKDGWFQVEEE